MKKSTLTYNFDLTDIEDGDYHALFDARRRDAMFAFAVPSDDGSVLLGRDHLGNIPLFYRVKNNTVKAATSLRELCDGTETIHDEGLRAYIGTGTVKTVSLFNEIHVVPPGSVVRAWPTGKTETLYQYRITPRELPEWSFADCLVEADRLLLQAAKRTLKEKTVGLFLSGGIDSALTGIYLKRAGAKVHAYTATPWGAQSEESRLAELNGRSIGVDAHTLHPMDTKQYGAYVSGSPERYANPCGATSQMAIMCLLQETDIGNERQVYFAQNCDTMNTSVPDQSLLFFLNMFPRFIRRALHRALTHRYLIDDFIAFRTVNLVHEYAPLAPYKKRYGALAQLAIAGMQFGHTPVDGDIVILPSLVNKQLVSNLFYDMDVIEFALGIPLQHRLEWSRESKIGIAIGKRVFRELARRHLPSEIVDRKKGLTIPTTRDETARAFFESLPRRIGTLALTLSSHRFAAELLRRFSQGAHASPSLRALFDTASDGKINASVAILTFNSAGTLRRALESVKRFDDIIICDGGSTDETLAIAHEFGARIIAQDPQFKNPNGTIADFSGIRNQTLAAAAYEWFLYIDSDEYLGAEAAEEIRAIAALPYASGHIGAYLLPRKTVVGGVIIDCATVYPNYQMRFFNKNAATGFIKRVHERIGLQHGTRTGKLQHPEYVPLDISEEEMKRKQLYYLEIEATRHENDTLIQWLKGPVLGALRSSLSYALRHVRILLLCRGTFMPLWVENMHHWYNWKLITMTGARMFSRKVQKQDAQ